MIGLDENYTPLCETTLKMLNTDELDEKIVKMKRGEFYDFICSLDRDNRWKEFFSKRIIHKFW